MSLGVWCDICGAFDQDMLSHLKIHSEQKRVIELRTSISGENTTKKECDHIVMIETCGSEPETLIVNLKSGKEANDYREEYRPKRCPECGEKLNLKKDE